MTNWIPGVFDFLVYNSYMTITAVIVARNESEMIANCVETAKWCDRVLVIDSGSRDDTSEIAKRAGAEVIKIDFKDFSQLRNDALKKVTSDWVFYLDADERVLPALATEIKKQMDDDNIGAMKISRQNIHYGYWLRHGGWQNDWVTRVFRVNKFKSWQGEIHESAMYDGESVTLSQSLAHLTHRSVISSLEKSINWTPMEAELFHQADHPPVTALTLIRKPVMEVIRRLILRKGWKDGMAGWVEALTQGMNRFLVYAQLWELQQQPSIDQKYQKFDQNIVSSWQEYNRTNRQ